jgi:hypothetical protein
MAAQDKLKEGIKELVREVMVESFKPEHAVEDEGGGQGMTDEEWDEARQEAKERKVPISQTRAYKRLKARERRTGGEDEEESGGIRERGRVTDPEHDRRLKRNREEEAA